MKLFIGVVVQVVVITPVNVLVVFLAGEAFIVIILVEVTIVLTIHMNTNIIVEIKYKLTDSVSFSGSDNKNVYTNIKTHNSLNFRSKTIAKLEGKKRKQLIVSRFPEHKTQEMGQGV